MRYFPTRGCEAPYWKGWPLDMPSAEGPDTPPDHLIPQGAIESSTTGSGPSKSSGSKRVEGKKCGVCGDRALGYNFNAITCESCKAFFRRNALKNKEFRCPFNECCDVTPVTRRFCQRCRLRKCFEVGMKKEWIMTDDEKKKKKKKIEENRARKIGDVESTLDDSSHFDDEDQNHSDSHSHSHSKTPILPPSNKPQAVVVGRVRGEEQQTIRKVRRISGQVDVHTQEEFQVPSTHSPEGIKLKLSSPVPPTREYLESLSASSSPQTQSPLNLVTESVPNESTTSASPTINLLPTSPILNCSSASLTFNLPGERLTNNILHHHSHKERSNFVPSNNPFSSDHHEESLVVGLLRSHSHGSAEEEDDAQSPQFPPPAWGCQIPCFEDAEIRTDPVEKAWKSEALFFVPSVIVKKEKESEEMLLGHGSPFQESLLCATEQLSSSTPLHQSGPSVISTSDTNKFDFNIREALQMLQPGCREREPSPPSTGRSVMDSILNTAISAEYSAFSLLSSSDSRELNQAESLKISELLEASRGLTAPLCEDANFKDLPNPSLINVINLTEIAIRRLIKMAKRISAFKNFCQEDQIALLKAGCTEMMILRSVPAYDPDKDVWKIQQDHESFKNIKLKVLKAAPGNVYEEHKRFMLAFKPDWRQDSQIMALLSAIALFTPQRPNVIHPEAVKHEQSSYLYLLKRYLECKYGGCIGKTNYHHLLGIIAHLHVLNEDHVRVFLEVNPQEVEPLLIEIFDLKQS